MILTALPDGKAVFFYNNSTGMKYHAGTSEAK